MNLIYCEVNVTEQLWYEVTLSWGWNLHHHYFTLSQQRNAVCISKLEFSEIDLGCSWVDHFLLNLWHEMYLRHIIKPQALLFN